MESLPAFQDKALYDGRTVQYARKAQNLAADLAARFGSGDERFAFNDVAKLAADSGEPAARWALCRPCSLARHVQVPT